MGKTATGKTTLDYARPQVGRRPRRLALTIAILALVMASYWFGSSVWQELRFLSEQRRWAACTVREGALVFDTASNASPYTDGLTGERIIPMVGFIPRPRMTFPVVTELGWCSTPLLHELISPAGHRRTVCIDVVGYDGVNRSGNRYRVVRFEENVYVRGWRPHGSVDGGRSWYVDCPLAARLQFFGARDDAADRSHFIIDYLYDGTAGRIDGFLQDDDTVRLVPDRGTGGGPNPRRGWSPIASQSATRSNSQTSGIPGH